ncbi:GatB/YqeY domain-containing protein [Polycladidibacter stylochi]|uniref:GatB/YqeY domain-containing protein n=1 Tax=Polycladidibacter stylochi TaxID=1807766 RepID=UPI000830054D|nr:GatB/YqeY domain-containing protein [Pseudovibrio stylochi]
MLREKINCALKNAQENGQKKRVATLRLINAAIHDRDVSARELGRDGLSDDELQQLLYTMLAQRLKQSDDCAGTNLPEGEREEVALIKELLPPQLSDYEMKLVCSTLVDSIEAKGLRDMGRCMSELKSRYPGQMDFARASCLVKEILSGNPQAH